VDLTVAVQARQMTEETEWLLNLARQALHILLLMICVGAGAMPQANPPAAADAQAHVGMGYEFEKDDRFSSAAEEFEAALALNPKLTSARYQLAVCYFALGRRDDARREFTRLRAEAHSDPSVIYFLGRLHLLDHNFDAAIAEFQSITAHPPFPDTAYYLGWAYLEKGNLPLAAQWFEKALPLNPRDYRIPEHLARIYQRQGRTADAEREFTLSEKLRHTYNQAAEDGVKCSAALEKGDADAAREACTKLDQPNNPGLLTTLGMIYGQHGHYADAVEPLRRAATLDPDSYEIRHNLGLTYFRLRRYSEAREALEQAVALRPNFFDSNALLGATLFALQQDSQAYEVLSHAHRLNPDDAETRDLLFRNASILGAKSREARNFVQALKYLQVAEELRPQEPQAHARLAVVYDETGDHQHANLERQAAQRLASSP
jgi:Flp pilus assembly protein TadD